MDEKDYISPFVNQLQLGKIYIIQWFQTFFESGKQKYVWCQLVAIKTKYNHKILKQQ